MTPEQVQQQRQQALNNAILGLGQLSSHELDPSSTRASSILYDLQQRIAALEQAEEAAGQQRHSEAERAAAYRDQHGRYTQPGTQAINRGEPVRPAVGSHEEQVAAVQQEMAARGLGRI